MRERRLSGEETVGVRVRRLRRARGWTQRRLAGEGISHAYVSRIERGQRRPSLEALRALSRQLGVSVEYLETGALVGAGEERQLRLAAAELELLLGRDRGRARELFELVLAEPDGAPGRAVARAQAGLGRLALAVGEHEEAIERLEAAVAVGGERLFRLRPEVGEALMRAYVAAGREGRALALVERLLEQDAEQLGGWERAGLALLAVELAPALAWPRAALELERALAAEQGLAGLGEQAERARLRACAAWERGEADEALGWFEQARALAGLSETLVRLGRANVLVAGRLIDQERAEQARPLLERAARLLEELGAGGELGLLRVVQSRQAAHARDAVAARARAQEALELLGEDPAQRGQAALALAQACVLAQDEDGAERWFETALDALATVGCWRAAAAAAAEWGQALRAQGRVEEAAELLNRTFRLHVRRLSGQ